MHPESPDQYAADIAAAMTRLVRDRQARLALGAGARRRVAEIALWDNKVRQWEDICAGIMADHASWSVRRLRMSRQGSCNDRDRDRACQSLRIAERRATRDIVSLVTIYVFFLMAIPSRYIFGPFGGAGSPSTMLGVVFLVTYLLRWIHPASPIGTGRQPIPAVGDGAFLRLPDIVRHRPTCTRWPALSRMALIAGSS